MRAYKVTLLRIGNVIVSAESKIEAKKIALDLHETEINWLSETEDPSNRYLVSLVEEVTES